MKVGVLFSGGKDSTRTVEWCLKNHEVKYLITFNPKNKDSYLFHSPVIDISKLSAKAIGIKQKMFYVSGQKEDEVEEMKTALRKVKIDALACGGIASNYQRQRFEYVTKELGINLLSPFWGTDEEIFLRETVRLGYNVIITSVSSLGLGKEYLGRKIDNSLIDNFLILKKKFGLNIVFEGGEGETLVLDGPIFKKRIEVVDKEVVWDEKTQSGFLNIYKARLTTK
ncbi:MAG: diphthine--ammonia ligase [Candidatus Aenigmatarchaeota archaeon]